VTLVVGLSICLAVQCATARLSTRTGLVSWTEPGTNSARGAKIRSGAYVIGLISWAANEGSTVSSLICDRWLTRKLATFMGSTDSLECRFSWHDRHSVAAAGLDLRLAGERRGAGRTHGMLRSTSALLRPETRSRPQVVQLLPFSSLHTSAWRNL